MPVGNLSDALGSLESRCGIQALVLVSSTHIEWSLQKRALRLFPVVFGQDRQAGAALLIVLNLKKKSFALAANDSFIKKRAPSFLSHFTLELKGNLLSTYWERAIVQTLNQLV